MHHLISINEIAIEIYSNLFYIDIKKMNLVCNVFYKSITDISNDFSLLWKLRAKKLNIKQECYTKEDVLIIEKMGNNSLFSKFAKVYGPKKLRDKCIIDESENDNFVERIYSYILWHLIDETGRDISKNFMYIKCPNEQHMIIRMNDLTSYNGNMFEIFNNIFHFTYNKTNPFSNFFHNKITVKSGNCKYFFDRHGSLLTLNVIGCSYFDEFVCKLINGEKFTYDNDDLEILLTLK